MKEKNVAAVVLTYNRLPLLKECIAAIQSQSILPQLILVVDNGSRNDTAEWLQSQRGLLHIRLEQNVGPAAGMKRGLEEAYERGYQWIWVMDDDGLPHEEALGKLLSARPDLSGAKNSIVLDKVDKKTLVFRLLNYKTLDDIKTVYVENEIMPWNGTLFHRNVIQQLGYPRAELYLWGEEMEYYYRIKTSGNIPLFSVKGSWHFHPLTKGFFYKNKWDVSTNDRAYFFIRNKYAVYLSRHKKNKIKALIHYLLFGAGVGYYILFWQSREKVKKLKLLWLAARDGLFSNYTRSPAEVQLILKNL